MNHPASKLSPDGLAACGSPQLAAWLAAQQLSLAFTTYRANRLMLLGTAEANSPESATLKLHERLFDRPMGLFADGESLWMAGRCQLWRLDNHLGADQRHGGGDRLYVPAVSLITGDVNAHELVITASGQLLFVNTAFSCLAGIEPGSSFAPSWQPPFITQLAGDDRCHLNGVALLDGEPTWASACGGSDGASSWRHNRADGGVLIHIPSGELAATGLSMPHSPRWHNGRLWLLNSGSGELGWIEDGAYRPLCALPGFARGLAFAGGYAVVGLSKLRSPQFTGLPLEERLAAEGLPGCCCGLRVIDLHSGSCPHSFDLPEPIDELFDVVVLPGVRQPRALGLQGDAIDCLVKLPDRPELVQVRPMAPSGQPHQGPAIRPFGLPEESGTLHSADDTTIRYQRVFHLTPANLAPYAALTFPSLAAGSSAIGKLKGELLGISAMANGEMVGLALAERQGATAAQVISLMVAPQWRGQGIGSHGLGRLTAFLAQEGVKEVSIRYQTSLAGPGPIDRLLLRLGWPAPQPLFLLLEGKANELATIPWPERFPLPPGYRLDVWQPTYAEAATSLGAPAKLQAATRSSGIDQDVSLALLHGDALVGWLIVDRTGNTSVRYSSLYVQPGHRIRGQALTLLAEGFRRQQSTGIAVARAAVPPESREMIRLVRRHLGRSLVISTAGGSCLQLH